eukprot:4819071-Prymnesium_polylepis.2
MYSQHEPTVCGWGVGLPVYQAARGVGCLQYAKYAKAGTQKPASQSGMASTTRVRPAGRAGPARSGDGACSGSETTIVRSFTKSEVVVVSVKVHPGRHALAWIATFWSPEYGLDQRVLYSIGAQSHATPSQEMLTLPVDAYECSMKKLTVRLPTSSVRKASRAPRSTLCHPGFASSIRSPVRLSTRFVIAFQPAIEVTFGDAIHHSSPKHELVSSVAGSPSRLAAHCGPAAPPSPSPPSSPLLRPPPSLRTNARATQASSTARHALSIHPRSQFFSSLGW